MNEGSHPRIDGYDEFVEIGRGGFATVYRARQIRLRRLVAVKVLHAGSAGPDAIARFEHECEAVGALSGHPNVVAVHDAGTTADGRPFLSMEYLPRGALSQRLAEGPLPLDDVLDIGARLADALSAAHRAEVLHRDVKPENVLIGPTGAPKLADFGIAVVADVHQTATGVVIGTVLHSAPEVLTGSRATVTADVYSLASTMYALVNGSAAYAGQDDEGVAPTMFRVVHTPLPDLRVKGVDPVAAELLERGMAKDPGDRYPSAESFFDAIVATSGRLASSATVMAPGLPAMPTPPPTIVAEQSAAAAWTTTETVAAVDAHAVSPPVPATSAPATPAPETPMPAAPAAAAIGAAALGAGLAAHGVAPATPGTPPPPTPPPSGYYQTPPPGTWGPPYPPAPEPKRRWGLVTALVIAVLVAIGAGATAIILLQDDDPPEADATTTSPSSSESSTTSSTTSTSTTTTTTSTTTTTTTPTSTTTTLPPAFTVTDARARIKKRYPTYTVTDESGFRIDGASVLIGRDGEGRLSAFLFADGQLLGRDSVSTSTSVQVVSLEGDEVVLGYDVWAANDGPPSEPVGRVDVTLRWDGHERFVPVEGDGAFPSTDPTVEGHR